MSKLTNMLCPIGYIALFASIVTQHFENHRKHFKNNKKTP